MGVRDLAKEREATAKAALTAKEYAVRLPMYEAARDPSASGDVSRPNGIAVDDGAPG